jgi:hypothetical protein
MARMGGGSSRLPLAFRLACASLACALKCEHLQKYLLHPSPHTTHKAHLKGAAVARKIAVVVYLHGGCLWGFREQTFLCV